MSKAKEEVKKKPEEKSLNKEEKLENFKKEDLITKLSEEKEQIKKKNEETIKEIKTVTDKIDENEKKLVDYSNNNKKLYSQLEELKKEVDEKLEHVSTKRIADKESAKKIKNSPYEKILLIKEKELKNVTKLITILKKDKDNLSKDFIEKSDPTKLIELEKKVKLLEQKNNDYLEEINYLKKLREEHKKCPEFIKNNDLDIKTLKDELYQLKQKDLEISRKVNTEIENREKTKVKLEVVKKSALSQRNECENLMINSNEKSRSVNFSKILFKKSILDTPNKNGDYQPYFQQYDPIRNIQKNLKENKIKNRKLFSKDDTTIHVKLPEIHNKNEKMKINSQYLSKSLATVRLDPDNEINRLFNEKERKLILKVFEIKDVEKLEERLEKSEKERVLGSKQYKNEMNELYNQINHINESLKMVNLETKEVEQKNKLYNYQLNEYKTEHSIQEKRIIETQEKLKALNQMLKEKENENHFLYSQVKSLKKIQEIQEEKMIREYEKQKLKKVENEENTVKQKSDEEDKDNE